MTYNGTDDIDFSLLKLRDKFRLFGGPTPGTIFAEAEAQSHDFGEVLRRIDASDAGELQDPVAWLAGSLFFERQGNNRLSAVWRFIAEESLCEKEMAMLDPQSLAYAVMSSHKKALGAAIVNANAHAYNLAMVEAD